MAHTTYYAMYALQHRGQESCGIVVNDRGVFTSHKDNGLIPDVFDKRTLSSLGEGNIAIGHVRYAAEGDTNAINAQPLLVKHVKILWR